MSKLKVGQELWYVPNYGDPGLVSVSKVGRKWAQISPEWLRVRIDIDTMRADHGRYSSKGRFYLSEDDYENEKALSQAWGRLVVIITNSCLPSGITIDDIKQAMKLLKLNDI